MDLRLPSIRSPRTLYDIYLVMVGGTLVMAIILYIWHGSIVRLEMVFFIGIVFLWAIWAIYHVLGIYAQESK